MKKLLKNILIAVIIILSVFVLGMLPTTLISLFITFTTDATFNDCVETVPFIILSIFSLITTAVYVNELVKSLHSDIYEN